MSKRGVRKPFRVVFQYPGLGINRHVKSDRWTALTEGRAIARRGAEVRVLHIREDGQEVELAHYDSGNPPPETDDDLA